MDMTVTKIRYDGAEKTITYKDIIVSQNTVINLGTMANFNGKTTVSTNDRKYPSELYAAGSDIPMVNISVNADTEEAVIYGAGEYVYGEAVMLSAFAPNRNDFLGWYDASGRLLSAESLLL